MKSLFFLMMFTPALFAQNFNINGISTAISKGDATALGQYFANSVEIAIADDEGTYSKAQAVQIVQKFFAGTSPSGFSQVHQGNSKDNGSKYCIGNLTTAKGTYRVYIYMTGENTIEEFRADKS